MDIKRKITLGAATLAVALGAGHLVQTHKHAAPAAEVADTTAAKPTGITPLVGSPQTDGVPPTPRIAASLAPLELAGPAAPATSEPAPRMAAVSPDAAPSAPPATLAAGECRVTLDVVPGAHGMLDLTLLSPCQPSTRVVLRHAGLAVTGRTSSGGALFTALPAMDPAGDVSAMFPDGSVARGAAPVDLSGVRRFAVQWLGEDRFALNAYRDGAAHGTAGHLRLGEEGQPGGDAGWMVALGDPTVDLPMLAEIYTWPAKPADVTINLEAAVTSTTCARELLGEVLESRSGVVTRSDITLAMPDCGAVGDFLVLNNLTTGMTTATAE